MSAAQANIQAGSMRPSSPDPATQMKIVLNVGAGTSSPGRLHPLFAGPAWVEVRLDIDPSTKPDIVGDVRTLSNLADHSADAIWCSHVLEHLHMFEVPDTIRAFRQKLRTDGFVIATMPDLVQVVEHLMARGLDDVAYRSPAGPITPLDMLYGHQASLQRGMSYMAHRCGFTRSLAERVFRDAGFDHVAVEQGRRFDLWIYAGGRPMMAPLVPYEVSVRGGSASETLLGEVP